MQVRQPHILTRHHSLRNLHTHFFIFCFWIAVMLKLNPIMHQINFLGGRVTKTAWCILSREQDDQTPQCSLRFLSFDDSSICPQSLLLPRFGCATFYYDPMLNQCQEYEVAAGICFFVLFISGEGDIFVLHE